MEAQRGTAPIFVTRGVGCASCMCDWGITKKQPLVTALNYYGDVKLMYIL